MAQTAKKGNSQLKRLLGNKNTVTLLGILICIGTLVAGYNYRINKAIDPSTIPFAKESIPSRTFITSKMIGNIKVSSDYVNVASNLVKSSEEVIGKYSTYKTTIPAGSLFYTDMLLTAEQMPDAGFANIDDGYTIYGLAVDQESTYSNSISAGDYIDLYLQADDGKDEEGESNSSKNNSEDKKVIFGLFIESIRVLAVKDSQGNNIIKHGIANGQPAELLFAVDEENYLLLYDAQLLGIKIVPVLHNANYTKQNSDANTRVSSSYLRQYITSRVYEV
jgi:hypothetical protein